MKICNKKNKKERKAEELNTILKQFDDFQFVDKKNKNNKENIKGRLLAYIPYANRVIQQYENTIHTYLRLNISSLAVISFFLTFFFVYYELNFLQGLPIILGAFYSAFSIILNIWHNPRKNPTQTLSQPTLWSYRDNVLGKRKRKRSKENATKFLYKFHREEEEFIREDLKQLFTLYLYQAQSAKSELKTRKRFRNFVSVYLMFFTIQIFILPLFN